VHNYLRDRQQNLEKIRRIVDYQLGKGAGDALFPDNAQIVFSRTTGRIRYIYLKRRLLATLRPTDGIFSLTVEGTKRLASRANFGKLWVKVSDDAAPFIAKGKSVFAKHVTDADTEIQPQAETIVLNRRGKVLAVGKAVLTGREMKTFKRGLAVRVRRGVAEK